MAAVMTAATGCADPHRSTDNRGGETGTVNLRTKISALQLDPCRGAQTNWIYSQCGRFMAEAVTGANTLKTALPREAPTAKALQGAVDTYEQLGCDAVHSPPPAVQNPRCSPPLVTVGSQLAQLARALEHSASSTPPTQP